MRPEGSEAMRPTMPCRDHLSRRARMLALTLAVAVAFPAIASAASSRELLNCQKAIESQVRGFSNFAIARLSNCTEKVVECRLAQEIDATDPAACLARAARACAPVPDKVDAQQSSRVDKIVRKCGLIPLAELEPFVGGLGFLNVVSDCGAATATQLASCVVADSRCGFERAVFRLDPRAQDSLADPAIDIAASFPCVAP
jgi:hypothetical protein